MNTPDAAGVETGTARTTLGGRSIPKGGPRVPANKCRFVSYDIGCHGRNTTWRCRIALGIWGRESFLHLDEFVREMCWRSDAIDLDWPLALRRPSYQWYVKATHALSLRWFGEVGKGKSNPLTLWGGGILRHDKWPYHFVPVPGRSIPGLIILYLQPSPLFFPFPCSFYRSG